MLGLDGRRLYTDSEHKALNYLMQGFEAVTVKSSVALAYKTLKKEKIDFQPLIIMHDEMQLGVYSKDVPAITEVLLESFREGPKPFGVMIHEGSVKSGSTWGDSH